MAFDDAFRLLNSKLAMADLHLHLICVGGYVLDSLELRATKDVDAFFSAPQEVRDLIKEVGDELNLNGQEVWLNDSVSSLNEAPPADALLTEIEFSNLTVQRVNTIYLIGMKLTSARDQDISDASLVIRKLNLTDPVELHAILSTMGFRVDASLLLESYGRAFGDEWLTQYLTLHGQQIARLY